MPRHINTTTPEQSIVTEQDAPMTRQTEAVDERALQLIEIDGLYGDDLPYERDRVVNETRFMLSQSAEAMLEAGRRLLLIKEHEPHGMFAEIVDTRLGLDLRAAQRMMKASIKFMSPRLGAKATALSLLGKTKLYELMVLDDDDLDALAQGGSVHDMTLDDVDRMTSRELRRALRESREVSTAQERLLADKNAKLDKLAAGQVTRQRVSLTDWPAEFQGYINQAQAAKRKIEQGCSDLDLIRVDAMANEAAPGEEAAFAQALETLALEMEAAIARAEERVAAVRRVFDQTLSALGGD